MSDIIKTEQEVHIRDYVAILRRRWTVVLLFFVIVVGTVTIGSFYMTPIYRATTTILIDLESPNVLTSTGSVALQQQHQPYKDYFRSQQEIIVSRGLIQKVFDEFDLINTGAYREAKDPLKGFLKTIKVEPIRDTRLLQLSVDNKDGELAARLANRIAEIYVLRNLYYISRDEIMNLLKNEYLKLEARYSEYSTKYKAKHPQMIRLKEEMNELVSRLEAVKNVDFTYELAREPLTHEKGQHALHGLKANNITIQDPAVSPLEPNKPKKRLNVLLAVLIGLFGGVGLALFFEYMLSDEVRDHDDLERTVPWPLLGGVPRMHVRGERLNVFKRDLFAHIRPKEPASEAYRSIRTAIFFSSTSEFSPKTALITSPGAQEGKTTTLCNLGIVAAQAGKKVLLVDADIRKPRLHDVFRHDNNKGLSEFLSKQAKLDELVTKTEVENLCFVSAGVIPHNPSELLLSTRVEEFIETAKKKFDLILFDTPPSAIVTDAIILSRLVDNVIVVVQSGRTSKRALSRMYKTLKDSNNKVRMILNRVDPTTSNYSYYYSYYYGKK